MANPRLLRVLLSALTLSALGCAMTPERLPEVERRFYYILPTPKSQAGFLEAEEENRQAYLERAGLWERWTALPAEEREAAAAGDVQVGYHEFTLLMAWGPPADTQDRDANGRPLVQHTYIRCTSGPKAGEHVQNHIDCDGTATETQVSIYNDIIAEIDYTK